MKFLKINFLLLLIVFGCKQKESEIFISGQVKGDIPYTIFYTSPINESAYIPFKDEITTDSLGNFQIKLPLDKASFIKIIINKEDGFQQITNATLVVEPEKSYIVDFDLDKKDKKDIFTIEGFNKIAQRELNALNYPIHIQVGASFFLEDSIASNVIFKIDSLKQEDISKFEALYQKDSISKPFFDLVKIDRDYYYTAVKGTVGFLKFLTNERNEGAFTKEFENMWTSCFENNLLTRPDFQNTEWGYAFIENYLYFKDLESFDFDLKKFRASREKLSRISYSIKQADSLLPKERLEFYKASFLFDNLIQKKYEKELITAFDGFKEVFPNSSYTKHLEPKIDDVIAFHEVIKQPFSEDVDFVKDYADITIFDEVLKSLKGKKLYVDFWATWCGPCKDEFKYNQELKALLSKYDYKPLYVSIDREENHEQWLDMIKFYDLKGTHIRANEVLSQEIREMGVNYIPRYFLVDEKGAIVVKKAKKPSQLAGLEKQLIELTP